MTVFRFVRNIHLYLALFLAPWVLVYGLSTLFLNHMSFFQGFYGKSWGESYVEKEMVYDKPLPVKEDSGGASRIDVEAAGRQILQDLGMDGAYWADARRDDSRITVNRNDIVAPRQITYTPADQKLVVKRTTFQLPLFLRRLHTRRGYASSYLADDIWAFVLDLLIVSILAWGVTGLWMWYKMKPTRRWGTLCAATGSVLFVVFLLAI
jgi:hypothetical protein